MLKRIICLVFAMLFIVGTCFAENNNEVPMDSMKSVALLDSLSASNGAGQYANYLKLNGYPGQEKFQIYYQDKSHDSVISFQVEYADLRGFNLDEVWDFTMPNGAPAKLSRRQVYTIFSSYGGSPAEQYIRQVFPGAYDDWLTGMIFSQDASRLVQKYLEKQHGIKTENRYKMADIKVS